MGVYGGFLYGGDTYSGVPELVAFNYELGLTEGRIAPINETPVDGSYVFCLGQDRSPGEILDIAFGNKAEVAQSFDLSNVKFVRATWRVRQPEGVPITTTVVGPSVKLNDVLNNGDTLMSITSTVDTFVHNDLHRIVRIAGATNGGNNGDKRITGIIDARNAVLDDGIVASENPLGAGSGTATLIGARWKASIRVAGTERAHVTERVGVENRRFDLMAHVSKVVGVQPVVFRLELVEE